MNCSRFPCPPSLLCSPDEMEQTPDSCCATCRTPRPEVPHVQPSAQPGVMNEGARPTEEEHRQQVLSTGGCLRNNRVSLNLHKVLLEDKYVQYFLIAVFETRFIKP